MYEFFSIGGSFCEKNNSRPKIVVFSGLFFVLLPQTEKRYAGIYLSGTVPRRGGQDEVLKIAPEGLELLSKAAYSDVSFYLRASHLQKLREILDDAETSDNDKFVAYTMLLNQCVAAEGKLPTCQDTGTAICIGHKGEDVYTGTDDAEHIARGVYETYKERNLRYSQVVPFTMSDEKY